MKRLFAILLACMTALAGCSTTGGGEAAQKGDMAKAESDTEIREPDLKQEASPQEDAKNSLKENDGAVIKDYLTEDKNQGIAAEQQQGSKAQADVQEEPQKKSDVIQEDETVQDETEVNPPSLDAIQEETTEDLDDQVNQKNPDIQENQKNQNIQDNQENPVIQESQENQENQPKVQETEIPSSLAEGEKPDQEKEEGSDTLTSGTRYAGSTYEANGFTVEIPQSWEGKYGVQRTEDQWIFYDAQVPEWGMDGRGELASIQVYTADQGQEAANTGEILGTDSQMARQYILTKPDVIPVPVFSGEDVINSYKEMAEALPEFAQSFKVTQ